MITSDLVSFFQEFVERYANFLLNESVKAQVIIVHSVCNHYWQTDAVGIILPLLMAITSLKDLQ